jgi:hypothetical protein
MPCVHVGALRLLLVLALWSSTLTVGASAIDAQDHSAWLVGGSLGLAPPVGGWRNDLDPGTEYHVSLTRRRVSSRWALEAALTRHSFTFADEALAARDDRPASGFIRQTSLGIGVRYALVEHSALSTWVSGGVAAHSVRTSLWRDSPIRDPLQLRDEYVPGLSLGLGLALGPFRIKPVAEVRLRLVALRERPLMSVPIAVGLRF